MSAKRMHTADRLSGFKFGRTLMCCNQTRTGGAKMNFFDDWHSLLEITLQSGYTISSLHYNVSQTYAGLLEGYPDEELNHRHVERLPCRVRVIFGEWPVHIVELRITVSERKRIVSP